jgi:hypothetical protein
MTPLEYKQFTSLLMLVPFFVVFSTGILFCFLIYQWARQRHKNQVESISESSGFSMKHHLLAQPSFWLAVKGTDLWPVQQALGLDAPVPCTWEEGLQEASERKLFISPPVQGWILIVGSGLPDPNEDVDRCFHFLRRISSKLGHVQFFGVNKVLGHHSWGILEKGSVFRAFAWSGQTIWNEGPFTAVEKELQMKCPEYFAEPRGYGQKDPVQLNLEKVNRLAAKWSVDPVSLDDYVWTRLGLVGKVSKS